ncbi:hypothetical protein HK102_012502, partial [Quaeritorhiza haematococci]
NSTATFKFIVSSVPFTMNWPLDGEDTWAGFPEERQEILEYIESLNMERVIVLSGDRHEVGVTRIRPKPVNSATSTSNNNNGETKDNKEQKENKGILEFSTSPLQQFYGPWTTYREVPTDEKIFAWRVGFVKWAIFTVEAGGQGGEGKKPVLIYRLFVNDYKDDHIYELRYDGDEITAWVDPDVKE